MILQEINGTTEILFNNINFIFPFLSIFFIVFLIALMIFLYLKIRVLLVILLVFLFSIIIGILFLTIENIPFTPWIQIFFIFFQSIIFIITVLEAYEHE